MILHSVLFWLRPDLTAAELSRFEAGLASLLGIATVRLGFIGRPAATPARPVVDGSWSCQLVVGFDDLAGHDHYQEVEVHRRFVAECASCWTRVAIVDASGSLASTSA